ncbi:hypothetical protein L484_018850 [Morus notabilis]|uniref:Transcription repressor n=1 Tax=Morus notabilis TaxID=981085 RepID=W9RPT9_9ROSA|nr:transcription repressor OFP6 [Morus notabilis]EXC01936.1 hypothetical protein L484_018850 [Morus notabilis]
MTSTARKKLHLNTVSVNLGCSCSRPKLSLLFHPKPKLKTPRKPHKRHEYYTNNSSSSSWTNDFDDTTTTTPTTTTSATPLTFSSNDVGSTPSTAAKKKKKDSKRNAGGVGRGFGRVGGEGVAVEKDSDDPYLDFRHSMLQMILENEIYSKDDLRELLNCFLQLNSASHHGIIVRAFTEIWDGVFSVRSAGPTKLHYGYDKSRDYY